MSLRYLKLSGQTRIHLAEAPAGEFPAKALCGAHSFAGMQEVAPHMVREKLICPKCAYSWRARGGK